MVYLNIRDGGNAGDGHYTPFHGTKAPSVAPSAAPAGEPGHPVVSPSAIHAGAPGHPVVSPSAIHAGAPGRPPVSNTPGGAGVPLATPITPVTHGTPMAPLAGSGSVPGVATGTVEMPSPLSPGQVAAAVVVPTIVVLAAIAFVYFSLRRRQDRMMAALMRGGVAAQEQNNPRSSMDQVVYYPKTNLESGTEPKKAIPSTEEHPARSSTSPEPLAKRAPPPPYVTKTTIKTPKPAGSPSFSQTMFAENPNFVAGGANSTENPDRASTQARKTSNRASSPTLGFQGGQGATRGRESDIVSAVISEGYSDGYVEYGNAETALAGTAERRRASVVDMLGANQSK